MLIAFPPVTVVKRNYLSFCYTQIASLVPLCRHFRSSEFSKFSGIFNIGILVFCHNNFNSVNLDTNLEQILKTCDNVMKT